MTDAVAAAIERFATSNRLAGRTESRETIDKFNAECGGIIPEWYCNVLTRFPMGGVELEWPSANDEGEFVGIEWMDIDNMRSEMLECYPGLAIHPIGYICIAGCTIGSGDQYYICANEGDDPPVYQIYHDVSDVADEIIANGRLLVFQKLSQLFDVARVA
ncbi:MAG: hypothetical protein WBD20_24775 [Pirellulaceae bacterium]